MNLGSSPARLGLESLLRPYSTNALTLEIGAKDSRYGGWFSNRVAMDILSRADIHLRADAHHLPFRDRVFEVILCTEVLQSCHTPLVALQEMFRVLKPGGSLLLSVPFASPIYDPSQEHYRFTRIGLTHLLRAWDIESIRESTADGASVVLFMHYWLFARKGLLWKIPKALWLVYWHLVRHSYRNGAKKFDAKSIMPAGYFVVARRP